MMLQEKRITLYNEVPEFWADLFGEEYALYDVYEMKESDVQIIRETTRKIGHIYFKTAKLLRNLDDETLLELGFPEESLSVIRLKPLTPESVIARIDLVKTKNGYKHFEINADTPTFIMELFKMNEVVTRHFGYENPNAKMEELLQKVLRFAIFESADSLQLSHDPHIVFTSHEEHDEDRETVKYLANLCGLPCKYVPLDQLQIIPGEGLYDNEGIQIDVLYRQTYPLEHLIHDVASDGTNVGLELLKLVQEQKVAIINPPSAFLLQSKGVQAVIWGMHEENSPFFTEEEHAWIDEHFLPTYFEEDSFLEEGVKYVKKPCFGREGDTVEIHDPTSGQVIENVQKNYTDSLPIFQQYVDMPQHEVQTTKGKHMSCLLLGSFLVGGNPGAIGFRAGNEITGNESYYLPIGIN